MKRFEGKNAAQFDKFLKGFNAKLDQLYADRIVSDTAYASLKEEVYDLAGNLAENKTATASSVEGSVSTLAPKYAVDGFSSTRWASNYGFSSTRWASNYVNDSWFQVDLGEAKTFDTVRVEWEFARAKTYKILVSDDQQNWTSVIQDNDGIITAHDGKETVHFAPVTARYVKFQGIERATDYGYSFYEFGIYNLSGSRE
nr:discoidin domain-containing protein [Paenibacillus sp. AR247]